MSMANLAWIGLSTGWVVRSAMVSGVSWERVAALTLPHGLLELAGFAMIAAVGCEGFIIVYRKLRFNEWSFSIGQDVFELSKINSGALACACSSFHGGNLHNRSDCGQIQLKERLCEIQGWMVDRISVDRNERSPFGSVYQCFCNLPDYQCTDRLHDVPHDHRTDSRSTGQCI